MKNVRKFTHGPALEIIQMEIGPMENFAYFIVCRETNEAAIVDPGWEVPQLLEAAEQEGLKITHALLTHHHYDHVMGVAELVGATDAVSILQSSELPLLGREIPNLEPVEPGAIVRVGKVEVTCVNTPGHTPGSQCFHLRDTLLSGDTLFIKACGRCDLEGSDPEAMYQSLHRTLTALPAGTVLYPGHNYAEKPVSTLGDEREENPYYQVDGLDAFLDLRMGRRRR